MPKYNKDLKKLLSLVNKDSKNKINPLQKLSLCMIVKNEENNLDRCLSSVKDIVDEIIIVDTGSTDKTIEIAEKYTSKIYHFEWINDFSAARNEAIKHSTGNWVLVLDADEELDKNSANNLRRLLIDIDNNVFFNIRIKSYDSRNFISSENYMIRLFKKTENSTYIGKVHEYIPTVNHAINISNNDVFITHYGYSDDELLKFKTLERNQNILDEIIEGNSSDGELCPALFYKGTSLVAIGKTDEGIDSLKRSISLTLKTPGLNSFVLIPYLKLMHLYSIIGDLDSLEDLLNSSTQKQELYDVYKILANSGDYWFYWGRIYMKHDNVDKAIESFSKSIVEYEDENSNSFKMINEYEIYFYSILNLSKIYLAIKDYNKSKEFTLKALNEVKIRKYYRVDYLLILIENLILLNENQLATEKMEELLSFENTPEEKDLIINKLSNLYLITGNFSKAVKIQALIRDAKQIKEQWYKLANLLEEQGDFLSSESVYTEILNHLPDDTFSLISRAVAKLSQNNKQEEAIKDLKLASKGSEYDDKIKIGTIYNKIGKFELAKNTFSEILLTNPNDYNSSMYLANIEESQNNKEVAKNILYKIITTTPDKIDAYIQLGNLLFNQKNYDQSLEVLKKAREIDTNNNYTLYMIILCYISLNDQDSALKNIEEYIKLDPDNQDVLILRSNLVKV